MKPGRVWSPGLLRGNASLNLLQRGRHRAGRRDNRPDRGCSAARTAFTRADPANVHGPMCLGKRSGPAALVLASSNAKSHTPGMMRTCFQCGRPFQAQRRRGPGFCSSRCRTAAHREGRRQSAGQQVMAITCPSSPAWTSVRDGNGMAAALCQAHHSHPLFGGRRKFVRRFVCPGERIVLLTPEPGALYVWRRFTRPGLAAPRRTYCSVIRREGVAGRRPI